MRTTTKLIITFILPIIMAVFAIGSSNVHAASQTANAYKLDIAIKKQGETVANPKFTVVFGKPAQATMSKAGDENSLYRVQATAFPGQKANGRNTVRIDLVVMEQISGAWVILGEPSLVAYDGKMGSVEVSGAAGAFKVEATATSEFNLKAVNFVEKTCPALDAPFVASAKKSGGPIMGIRADPDCCSVGCSNGSGQTMTCCGAIECCA